MFIPNGKEGFVGDEESLTTSKVGNGDTSAVAGRCCGTGLRRGVGMGRRVAVVVEEACDA